MGATVLSQVEERALNLEELAEENARLREEVAALRRFQERFTHLDDLAYDGICVIQDFQMKYANKRLQELMEYELHEIVGMPFGSFLAPEDLPKLVQAYDLHMGGARDLGYFDFRIVTKSGQLVDIRINSSVIEFDGRAAELVVVQDHRAQLQMQQLLAAADSTVDNLIHNSLAMVAVFDQEGRYQKGNKAFEEFAGCPCEGLNLFTNQLFPLPDYGKRVSALRDGGIMTVPELWMDRAGRSDPMCLSLSAFGIADPEGGVSSLVLSIFDQTERKNAENQRRLLTAAVEAAASAVVIAEADGRILYVNPAFDSLVGRAVEHLKGAHLHEALSSGDLGPKLETIWRDVSAGQVYRGEIMFRRPDGEAHSALAAFAPMRDSGGSVRYIAMTFQDVTETRRAEESLRRSEERLRQAQKMEALGLLAGGVAHDFNNVLTIIMSHCEWLADDTGVNERYGDELAGILKASDRARGMVDRLKSFGRREPPRIRRLDLNEVVEEFLRMMGRALGENIALLAQADADPGLVRGDRSQIDQILLNLVINARDAMPRGGRLTLSTQRYNSADAPHGPLNPGDYVRLSVIDTGVGMPASVQQRIFEPFFTTKTERQGTGLGLATVYGIVQSHRGEIFVDSAPGSGSAFHVYLPSVDPNETKEGTDSNPVTLHGSETVLVVEDESDVLYVVQRTLEKSGYTVLPAGQPSEALAIAKAYPGGIDLLLADVMMPVMNGVELAQAVYAQRPSLRVLYMSGHEVEIVEQMGGGPLPIQFLKKPFTSEQLQRRVREVLGDSI